MPNPRKEKIRNQDDFNVDFLQSEDIEIDINKVPENVYSIGDFLLPKKLIEKVNKRKEEAINPNDHKDKVKLLVSPKKLFLPLPRKKWNKAEEEIDRVKDEDEKKIQLIISLKQVDVKYNLGKESEYHALKNISLDIYEGEFIMLFGPSGCGKSTLMNVVAGLERPCNGRVIVDEQDILALTSDEVADFHTDKVGMVFQAYNLIESLSVGDNIALPQLFRDYNKKEKAQRVDHLLKRFSITEHAKKLPVMLSGGQQQRVGIARSLVNDPLIILADEPIGNLDSKSAEDVIDIFKNLNKTDGKTILMVTHNPDLLKIAHRIFYMKDGEIVKEEIIEDRRPEKLRKKEKEAENEITKEISLLSKSFSHLSKQQVESMWLPLKAAAITDVVVNKYSKEQVDKIKEAVKKRLMNLMTKEEFFNFLDKSQLEEGIGLDRRIAGKFSDKIDNLISESEKMKEIVRLTKDDELGDLIDNMRLDILRFYKRDLLPEQIDILNRAIYLRIKNKIDKNGFLKKLSISFKKGGVGINYRSARKMTREMELLMLLKLGEKYNV